MGNIGSPENSLSQRLLFQFERLYETLPADKAAIAFRLAAIGGGSLMKSKRLCKIMDACRPRLYRCFTTLFAPSAIYDFDTFFISTLTRSSFWFWFAVAFFFCLVMNAVLSCAAGTLFPPTMWFSKICAVDTGAGFPARRFYFAQDWFNLTLYAVVVPMYVALDVTMFRLWARYWTTFYDEANAAEKAVTSQSVQMENRSALGIRLAGAVVINLLIVGFFISNYINDIVRSQNSVPVDYWFVKVVGENRVLNSVGAYYLLMNGVLLVCTIMSLFAYVSLGTEVIRRSRYGLIPGQAWTFCDPKSAKLGGDRILVTFNNSYICIKLLILVYAVNLVVWAFSPLGSVDNAFVAIVALTAISIFIIPIPRLYSEYKWHALRDFAKEAYEDTRTTRQKWTSKSIDAGILALLGLLWTLKYRFNPLGFSFEKLIKLMLGMD
jgi:hypothetical protein